MKNLHNVFINFRTTIIFLLLVALITVIFGSMLGVVKQTYRSNANDPQVEVIDQVASLIAQGVPLEAILGGSEQIDMAKSLGLFVMIFDKDKKLVSGSAQLDGQTPTPPDSVFEKASEEKGNRFTWEPKDGLRVAAILKSVDDKGYVLAGRSLTEIEDRQEQVTYIILISWVISVFIALVLTLALKPRTNLTIIEETNVTVNEAN